VCGIGLVDGRANLDILLIGIWRVEEGKRGARTAGKSIFILRLGKVLFLLELVL
jgi:hypothetical protein